MRHDDAQAQPTGEWAGTHTLIIIGILLGGGNHLGLSQSGVAEVSTLEETN